MSLISYFGQFLSAIYSSFSSSCNLPCPGTFAIMRYQHTSPPQSTLMILLLSHFIHQLLIYYYQVQVMDCCVRPTLESTMKMSRDYMWVIGAVASQRQVGPTRPGAAPLLSGHTAICKHYPHGQRKCVSLSFHQRFECLNVQVPRS